MSTDTRRCCALGCEARRTVPYTPRDGWYKVSAGFMQHACPEHRAAWEAYDRALRAWQDTKGSAYEAAVAEFEATWDRAYNEAAPAPTEPPWQSSL